MTTSIQTSAMLVSLNICQWSARRLDRKASAEVSKNHGAKNAGNFNKVLIDPQALEPLRQIEGAARQYHYSVTLPWGDKGERLLPSTLFMDYTGEMSKFRNEFEQRVHELVKDYPTLVQEARQRLGTLYDPSEYPAEIASRFSFKVEIGAVQDPNDFRVNLNQEYVEQIKDEIFSAQQARQKEAVEYVWGRVRDTAQNIITVCTKEKPRFFESLTENAGQLADVLPSMNLAGDPKLDQASALLRQLAVPVETLRKSPTKRKAMVTVAEELMQLVPCNLLTLPATA